MITQEVHVISLPPSIRRRKRLTDTWPYSQIQLNIFDAIRTDDGMTGCLFSHQALLSKLRRTALILEDDAVFSPDFTLRLEPPQDWEVLWLGRQFLVPPIPVDYTWVRPVRAARTHAYIVRDPQLAYDAIKSANEADMGALYRMSTRQYALRVATVGQAGPSVINGQERGSGEFWNEESPAWRGGPIV